MRKDIRLSHIAPTRPKTHDEKIGDKIGFVILAGSTGQRMKSYGPKGLYKLRQNYTLLNHQVDVIRSVFNDVDISVVVGYEADKVIKKIPDGVRIIENQLYNQTHEGEQIRLGLINNVCNRVVIINGDIFFNASTFVGMNQQRSCLFVDSNNQMDASEPGVTIVDNKKATIISYGIESSIWCQMMYLVGKDVRTFRSICSNRSLGRTFMFEATNKLLDKTNGMIVHENPEKNVIKINNKRSLQKVIHENFN